MDRNRSRCSLRTHATTPMHAWTLVGHHGLRQRVTIEEYLFFLWRHNVGCQMKFDLFHIWTAFDRWNDLGHHIWQFKLFFQWRHYLGLPSENFISDFLAYFDVRSDGGLSEYFCQRHNWGLPSKILCRCESCGASELLWGKNLGFLIKILFSIVLHVFLFFFHFWIF